MKRTNFFNGGLNIKEHFPAKLRRVILVLFFVIIAIFSCAVIGSSAQTYSLEPAIINDDITSSDVFKIFSPQEVCYNKSSVILNFSLTARNIGTIGYSLDKENVQRIQTKYVTDTENDYRYGPFLNKSMDNQLTVVGDLVFENLANGNHTLRLYLGHHYPVYGYEVEAYTEVRFSIEAPTVMLIQKQDSYQCGDIPLQLFVSEPTWLVYSLDNQANDTIIGNTTLTNLSAGFHNLTVYAFNEAGCWGASNTICFEILGNPADSPSADSRTSISQEDAEFPFLMVVIVFIILICCMFPIIHHLERVNEQAAKSNMAP